MNTVRPVIDKVLFQYGNIVNKLIDSEPTRAELEFIKSRLKNEYELYNFAKAVFYEKMKTI